MNVMTEVERAQINDDIDKATCPTTQRIFALLDELFGPLLRYLVTTLPVDMPHLHRIANTHFELGKHAHEEKCEECMRLLAYFNGWFHVHTAVRHSRHELMMKIEEAMNEAHQKPNQKPN